MRRTARIAASAAFAAIAVGCDGDPTGTGPIDRLPRSLTVTEQRIASSTTDFGLELLRRVHDASPNGNVLLSPLSASMALGMTMNGAAGETWDGMARTLRLDGVNEGEINTAYRDLIDLLTGLDPAVEVGIANAVWYRQGLTIESAFASTVRNTFGAEVRAVDPFSPTSVTTINNWVSDATRGRIESIIVAIPPNLVAYLINAVFFKGAWTKQFDPRDTRDGTFTRDDGTEVSVPMMNGRIDAGVLRTQLFTGLDLGYGGGAYRMTILVPSPGVNLADVVATLEAGTWRGWMDGFVEEKDVTISMPKYEVEFDAVLNETLAAMGMDAAFDGGRADFSRLVSGGGVISEVKQKTFMEVNEEGTVAAAATSVAVIDSAPVPIVVDRPFVVAIRERLSGTVLFIGAIRDP